MTAQQLMAKRKKLVREAQEAFDNKEFKKAMELENQALALLEQAQKLNKFTTADAYGLIGS